MKPWEHAFPMMAAGYPCFPVRANSKKPPITAWPQRATTDADEFRRMVEKFGDPDANYGVSTADLIVVDIDIRKGGAKTIYDMSDLSDNPLGVDFPETLTVRTPSGGWHLYYRTKTRVRSGTNVLGPGVDIRGDGGYVIGPGSVVDGKEYVIVDGIDLEAALAS